MHIRGLGDQRPDVIHMPAAAIAGSWLIIIFRHAGFAANMFSDTGKLLHKCRAVHQWTAMRLRLLDKPRNIGIRKHRFLWQRRHLLLVHLHSCAGRHYHVCNADSASQCERRLFPEDADTYA